MIRKYIKILILVLIFSLASNGILAQEKNITKEVGDTLEINRYLNTFEEYLKENDIENFSVNETYTDLISGKGLNYDNILDTFVSNLFIQIRDSTKNIITIFIVIIIMAVLSSLELDKDSDVVKISKLIVIICVSSILLKNYIQIVEMFKSIIKLLGNSMQIVSTFLTGILVASGKITSTGIITPLLLFISNFICVVTEYVVIPFFTISIVINVVSKISENIKLDKISGIFRKSSLCIFSSVIAIFILVLSTESSVTKSIDNIFFKTTQNVISSAVPVVGKFLSDSLDTVLGATELIGKVGGAVALVTVILIVSIPLIKILVVFVLYKLLSAFSEPINEDKTISDFIDEFANVYKDMLGILIGVLILFIMSTGIIMKLVSTISG